MERKTMRVETRDFGEIEVGEKEIVTFCQPVYGFESLKRYVFLHDESLGEQFAWLQSVEDADVCFILANPSMVDPAYAPRIPAELAEELDGETMWWLVAVIPEQLEKATVNLKSPIVVNFDRGCAAQVILEEDLPIHSPLFHRGKEKATC